ncbi:MAG: YqzL family protein [Candidatus Xenobia bacterium]
MATNFYWNLFFSTGNPTAYLLYRESTYRKSDSG